MKEVGVFLIVTGEENGVGWAMFLNQIKLHTENA